MNLYYELSDSVVDPEHGKYFALYDVKNIFDRSTRYGNLLMKSERVWGENSDGQVHFIKHRWKDCTQTPVDMKEFFWVKLRSVTV